MTQVNQRVVAILQARMGSCRLPGKVMAKVAGQPMLALLVKRLLPARSLRKLVVATSRLSQDDPIEALVRQLEIPCYRGSEEDCLDRYYQAAREFEADIVVRLTGDNPLVDAGFVDWALEQYLSMETPCDYMASAETFPVGLSIEVFSYAALETAWKEAARPECREHVTPFIYGQPKRFRIGHLPSPQNYSHMRWTVDTPEDLALIRNIYAHFGHGRFSWREALDLMDQNPQWLELNRHVQQKELVRGRPRPEY